MEVPLGGDDHRGDRAVPLPVDQGRAGEGQPRVAAFGGDRGGATGTAGSGTAEGAGDPAVAAAEGDSAGSGVRDRGGVGAGARGWWRLLRRDSAGREEGSDLYRRCGGKER